MRSSLTPAGPLSLQMFLRRSDGLLHHGGDLQLDSWGIAGQQQSMEHIQELHRQQLQQKFFVFVSDVKNWIISTSAALSNRDQPDDTFYYCVVAHRLDALHLLIMLSKSVTKPTVFQKLCTQIHNVYTVTLHMFLKTNLTTPIMTFKKVN